MKKKPFNEGRACDAVLRLLEMHHQATRINLLDDFAYWTHPVSG